ncbi:MAG: FMN-binding protein [candidate division WOR-3 bacterium]
MKRTSPLWTVFSLFITCLIAGFALSQVYSLTKSRIDFQRNVLAFQEAFAQVFPNAERFEPATPDSLVWLAFVKGERIGSIIKVAKQGYGGLVPVTAGIDLDGKIVAIKVASPSEGLKETPGLGLKATEEDFRKQFSGKTATQLQLTKDGGTIQAITGATITSRAITEALREGMEKYQEILKPQ